MTSTNMNIFPLLAGSVLLAVMAASACAPSSAPSEAVEMSTQPALTQNALTQNALTQNALTQNALTQNALTQNALTQNALTQNALTQNALEEDPEARLFLMYLIKSAFRPDQCETFDWAHPDTGATPATYCGALGLCPQWRDGGVETDVACQEWVTAGLLAHVNDFGVKVPISVRASTPFLSVISEYETEAYVHREGAFWGNLFASTRQLYAGTDIRNVEVSVMNNRVCALSTENCEIEVIGPVDEPSVTPALERGWACDETNSGWTWSDPLGDPAAFFEAYPEDTANHSLTGDEVVSDCHSYLSKPDYSPTAEELATHTPRAVTVYLTEAAVKRVHGCSETMFPGPVGGCTTEGATGCANPNDPCCESSSGILYCEDWLRPNGDIIPQACVNDEVWSEGVAKHTCKPTS